MCEETFKQEWIRRKIILFRLSQGTDWLQILESDDSTSKLVVNLNTDNKVGMGGKVSF